VASVAVGVGNFAMGPLRVAPAIWDGIASDALLKVWILREKLLNPTARAVARFAESVCDQRASDAHRQDVLLGETLIVTAAAPAPS
jgi:hypothetical protein